MDEQRKTANAPELREQLSAPTQDQSAYQERSLEDDGRGWCGVRTYITGPQAIGSGKSAEYKSNYHIDFDPGCRSGHIDEVAWTVTDMPSAYQSLIHIEQQNAASCVVAVEAGVPSGVHFTLHATPSAHALGRGASSRVACQVNKSDSQIVNVS